MTISRRLGSCLLLCLAAAALLPIACGKVAEESTMIDVVVEKTADTATVTMDGDSALIEITSATGIGGLAATLTADEWPEQIAVRLRLRGLESLEIRYGDIAISTGVSHTGEPNQALILSVTQPDGTIDSASPSADIYYPDIQPGSDDQGDYFDVALPVHFFQGDHKAFNMRWIDFYRG